MRFCFPLFAPLWLCFSLAAQELTVDWADSRARLGEKLRFVLLSEEFTDPRTLSIELTETNQDWEYLESEFFPNRAEVWVQCFAIKPALFPGLTIRYRQGGEARVFLTGPQYFYVSAPETDLTLEPPIRGLRAPDEDGLPWWVFAGGALFLILLGLFLWRRSRKKKGLILPGARDIPDPWRLAKERIALLRRHLPEDEAGAKEHVFLLNETLKQYLGARAGYSFLELTSFEVVEAYSGLAWHDAERRDALKAWLARGDMAKFAREIPDRDELTRYIDSFESWLGGAEAEWRAYQAELAASASRAGGEHGPS